MFCPPAVGFALEHLGAAAAAAPSPIQMGVVHRHLAVVEAVGQDAQ
jgi:hypothetical protein